MTKKLIKYFITGIGTDVGKTVIAAIVVEADARLYAYNHNIYTSEEYYKEIISTRGYEDRLQTIKNARKASLTVCSGGIIGLGEKDEDRISMLYTLALMRPQPESVPINALVAVEGYTFS